MIRAILCDEGREKKTAIETAKDDRQQQQQNERAKQTNEFEIQGNCRRAPECDLLLLVSCFVVFVSVCHLQFASDVEMQASTFSLCVAHKNRDYL